MRHKTVTIWHKNKNAEYDKTVCRNSLIFSNQAAEIGGSGITAGKLYTIRCFTTSELNISLGDKILPGYSLQRTPPQEVLIVKGIRKNLDGTRKMQHYKLECI